MFPLLPPSPSPSSTPLWYIPSLPCGAFLTVLGSLRSQSHLSRGASVKQEAGPHHAHTSASAAERPLSLTSRCKQSRKGRSRAQSAAGCENSSAVLSSSARLCTSLLGSGAARRFPPTSPAEQPPPRLASLAFVPSPVHQLDVSDASHTCSFSSFVPPRRSRCPLGP